MLVAGRSTQSLDRMLAISDRALGHLHASDAASKGLAWVLVVAWYESIGKSDDRDISPGPFPGWHVSMSGLFPVDRASNGASQLAPGVFVKLLQEGAPVFPGADIDLVGDKLGMNVHAV